MRRRVHGTPIFGYQIRATELSLAAAVRLVPGVGSKILHGLVEPLVRLEAI